MCHVSSEGLQSHLWLPASLFLPEWLREWYVLDGVVTDSGATVSLGSWVTMWSRTICQSTFNVSWKKKVFFLYKVTEILKLFVISKWCSLFWLTWAPNFIDSSLSKSVWSLVILFLYSDQTSQLIFLPSVPPIPIHSVHAAARIILS